MCPELDASSSTFDWARCYVAIFSDESQLPLVARVKVGTRMRIPRDRLTETLARQEWRPYLAATLWRLTQATRKIGIDDEAPSE
jgi:hypothetical protein